MQPHKQPNMMMKKIWLLIAIAGLAGCAHQTPFNPSQGHIGSEQDNQQKVAPAGEIPKPVKKLTYVPPPKPKAKEQTYSVVVSDVPIQEVLFALARESKLNVDIHPAIQGKVTLNAVDQTLPAILDRLSKQLDLRYKVEGNVISIAPDLPTLRTYKVNYVNIDRESTSSINVAPPISASSAAGGSSTKITSQSKINFWELLGTNIREILKTTKTQTQNEAEKIARSEAIRDAQEDRLKQVEAVSKAGAGAEKLFETAFKDQNKNTQDTKLDVIVNSLAGTVTVMGTERQHSFIQQYLDTVTASVQRQVLIEATIIEVTLNDRFQQGIDWQRLSGDGANGLNITQTLGGAAAAAGNQLTIGFAKSTWLGNLAANIRLLDTFGKTKVLSSPKLMTLNNQTSLLKVTNDIVYFLIDVQSTTNQTSTEKTFTSKINTVPEGIVMSVTPQVNENGNVILTVRPSITRKIADAQDPNPALPLNGVKNFIPVMQTQEIESVLNVLSGQTVVLGGLMQDNLSNTKDSVPGVSKLPLVGKLFEGKDDTVKKTELVIFLRPTVIPSASLESDELKSFKQYLPENQFPVASDEPAN
jgi:general secretion pathway protein D